MTPVDYTDRALALWAEQRALQRGAVDRWIAEPDTGPTPAEARRLAAEGWTPRAPITPLINQYAAEAQPGGVATTTEATVLDTTQDTPILGDRPRAALEVA